MQARADTATIVMVSFWWEEVSADMAISYTRAFGVLRKPLHLSCLEYPECSMPVQIGGTTHSFREPTGLLSDCHRRIEMFLGSLMRVAELVEKPLDADARTAMERSLRYFREAAPKHTADEEESLFPRLRRMHNPEIDTLLGTLDPLERDHRRADSLHAQVDRLGRKCLSAGSLSREGATEFAQPVTQLASIYKEHIRIEDEFVFPVAGKVLSAEEKAAIADEMAARRR